MLFAPAVIYIEYGCDLAIYMDYDIPLLRNTNAGNCCG